jgi:hypothetical protein
MKHENDHVAPDHALYLMIRSPWQGSAALPCTVRDDADALARALSDGLARFESGKLYKLVRVEIPIPRPKP